MDKGGKSRSKLFVIEGNFTPLEIYKIFKNELK